MTKEYLLRGKLIYEFKIDKETEVPIVSVPTALSINLKQFSINISPNQEAYIDDTFYGEITHKVDNDYPLSLLYIDVKVNVGDQESPTLKADEDLRKFEAMLRLHQKGGIYVSRHFKTWQIEDDRLRSVIFIDFKTKPEPDVYSLGGYVMDEEFLVHFPDFFNRFWDVINKEHQPVYNALLRFSSSYEKFTLADRLIDLMIALEALFNESPDSIAYKVSLRCSSLIGINKKEKTDYFKELKRFYKDRNAIDTEAFKKQAVNLDLPGKPFFEGK